MSIGRNEGEIEIARFLKNRETLEAGHVYDRRDEHDACGVGLVASIDGTPRREVVEAAIAALKAVWHRGAVDADGKTGDGAGIHVQVPRAFFEDHVTRTGHRLRPGRGHGAARDRCGGDRGVVDDAVDDHVRHIGIDRDRIGGDFGDFPRQLVFAGQFLGGFIGADVVGLHTLIS